MSLKFRKLSAIFLTVLICMSIGGISPASVQGLITSEIVLFEGWNLIGLPCTPEDSSIDIILADILDNVESVWAFDGTTDTWSSYSPGAPGDLTEMFEDKGYWIKMENADILTVYGGCTGTVVVEVPVYVPVEVHPLDGQTIRIGMTSASTYGMENTVILAEEILEPKINEYVSSLGFDITFDFIIADNQDLESKALENTQSFKAMGIDLILGHGWSGQCSASLSYVNENNMLMLSSSTSPLLAISDDRLFRTCPTDFVQAPAIATMWETWGVKAVLNFFRGDAWGDGIYNLLDTGGEYEAHGIVNLGKVRYDPELTEFSNYLDVANDIIGEAIEEYGGAKYVGFQYFGFSESRTYQAQAADYPNLMDVIWMGTESNGRSERMIDETGELCLQTRHFSALMGVDEGSHLWNEFEEIYYEKTHYMPSFNTAAQYDAAWLLVETILKTSSIDASVIAEALIPTSYMMHGISGWMPLDENGDRAAQVFDIWGYMEQDDCTIWFQKWGTYDGRTNEVDWDDGKIIAAGIDAPRVSSGEEPTNEVDYTWSGSVSRNTEPFYVSSDIVRITWSLESDEDYYSFAIALYEVDTGWINDYWYFLEESPEGDTYAYVSPGYYYLEFDTYNCNYVVTLETFSP